MNERHCVRQPIRLIFVFSKAYLILYITYILKQQLNKDTNRDVPEPISFFILAGIMA